MVRIKVVKASQLVLVALAVLAVIAAVVAGSFALSGDDSATPPPGQRSTEKPVETLPPVRDGASIQTDEPAVAAMAARVSRSRTDIEVLSPYDEDKLSNADADDEIMLVLLDHDNEEIIDIEIISQQPVLQTDNDEEKPESVDVASAEDSLEDGESGEDDDADDTDDGLEASSIVADSKKAPEVLIYHTHSREAYEQNQDKPQYVEVAQWRTADPRFSVLRVGEVLTEKLENLGISVIHDTTDHEPPKHGTSYSRSLVTLENYYKNEPSLKMFIDLHRDGYVEGQKGKNTITVDGVEVAKLMVLIGNGEGSTGSGGFAIKPDWEENHKLATELTDAINARAPGLCRSVMINTGRYNQHVSTSCILVEVGNNKNTLEEALAAMPYLAEALEEVLGTM